MSSKRNSIITLLISGILLIWCNSCSTITEDLPPCGNYVSFSYTRNMKFADALQTEVKQIDLFVFDENDRFVTRLSGASPFVEGYRMELPLPPGKYHLIAWAGLNERSYEFASQWTEGESTPEQLTVKMRREQPEGLPAENSQELEPLWHCEAEMEIVENESRTARMDLTKDTNRLRLIVQADADTPLSPEDFLFSVTGSNGYLNYDNSLLPDDKVVYKPYYQAGALVKEQNEGGLHAVIAEMNTLRLIEEGDLRLRIDRRNGSRITDINLTSYLLLTKMEGHQMPAQEYLDRQDEYAVILLLNANYMIVQIQINDWIIRPQEGDL